MALRKKSIALLAIAGSPIVLLLGWHSIGYPESLDEAYFLHQASSRISSGANELDLAGLMPGDWELVCGNDGYDGPLYLARYNRTFESGAPAQDGAWGLVFISPDGSYSSVAGSCRVPGAQLNTNGCTERSKARMVRALDESGCPEFSIRANDGAT